MNNQAAEKDLESTNPHPVSERSNKKLQPSSHTNGNEKRAVRHIITTESHQVEELPGRLPFTMHKRFHHATDSDCSESDPYEEDFVPLI